MRVFSDFHHEDLYESLCILFEDRLHWELYRPIGLDWYQKGFWKVFPHITTAQQYLAIDPAGEAFQKRELTEDNFRQLSVRNMRTPNGTYVVKSGVYKDRLYKAITLPVFAEMKFDVLVCSIPAHIPIVLKLQKKYQPQAKVVFQVGNNWIVPLSIKNVLCSSWYTAQRLPKSTNHVFYHQEFDAEAFLSPPERHSTASLVSMTHYMQDKPLFHEIERKLPSWTCKMHGAGNREGSVGPQAEKIREAFKEMGFLLHIKREGDGFGYNLFNAAAAGVPIVCRRSQLRGMTAERLLIPGETCIDIDGLSADGIVDSLLQAEKEWALWHKRVKENFEKEVSFKKDFTKIKAFLQGLL